MYGNLVKLVYITFFKKISILDLRLRVDFLRRTIPIYSKNLSLGNCNFRRSRRFRLATRISYKGLRLAYLKSEVIPLYLYLILKRFSFSADLIKPSSTIDTNITLVEQLKGLFLTRTLDLLPVKVGLRRLGYVKFNYNLLELVKLLLISERAK